MNRPSSYTFILIRYTVRVLIPYTIIGIRTVNFPDRMTDREINLSGLKPILFNNLYNS